MKKSVTTIIVIIIIIILGVWMYSASKSKSINNSTVIPVSQSGHSNQLFSNSSLSQNAYLISTPTYDANTKTALSGFTVTSSVQTDGSTKYTLNAQNPEYTTQTYIVKPGEKLYFIDSLLADDNGNADKTLRDDTAVVVDANGYIVNQ